MNSIQVSLSWSALYKHEKSSSSTTFFRETVKKQEIQSLIIFQVRVMNEGGVVRWMNNQPVVFPLGNHKRGFIEELQSVAKVNHTLYIGSEFKDTLTLSRTPWRKDGSTSIRGGREDFGNGVFCSFSAKFNNPFTPENDQCQISSPAPPEILHHTVRRTWLFILSLLMWKMIIMQILATSILHLLFKRLGECTFWAQEWKG